MFLVMKITVYGDVTSGTQKFTAASICTVDRGVTFPPKCQQHCVTSHPTYWKSRIPSTPDHFLMLMKQSTQYLKAIIILSFDICVDFLSIFPRRVSDETFLYICDLTHACFIVQPITSSLLLSYLIIMAKNTNFVTFYSTVSTYM